MIHGWYFHLLEPPLIMYSISTTCYLSSHNVDYFCLFCNGIQASLCQLWIICTGGLLKSVFLSSTESLIFYDQFADNIHSNFSLLFPKTINYSVSRGNIPLHNACHPSIINLYTPAPLQTSRAPSEKMHVTWRAVSADLYNSLAILGVVLCSHPAHNYTYTSPLHPLMAKAHAKQWMMETSVSCRKIKEKADTQRACDKKWGPTCFTALCVSLKGDQTTTESMPSFTSNTQPKQTSNI